MYVRPIKRIWLSCKNKSIQTYFYFADDKVIKNNRQNLPKYQHPGSFFLQHVRYFHTSQQNHFSQHNLNNYCNALIKSQASWST